MNGKILGEVGKIATSAVLGGTVSEIGGGKFANGTITGAYAMLFNDLIHKYQKKRTITLKYLGQVAFDNKPATSANIAFVIKVRITETHYVNGDISIDGIAFSLSSGNDYDIHPALQMRIEADDTNMIYKFTKQYYGTELTSYPYTTMGEIHTPVINYSQYKNVNVHLKPSWSVSHSGMGRTTPTLVGTIGVVPINLIAGKSYKLK
ncbi:MAG: hypothetical protein K6D91_08860 [Prevotella sp.]|nr:hypothetical protein [Prevotella sp.]